MILTPEPHGVSSAFEVSEIALSDNDGRCQFVSKIGRQIFQENKKFGWYEIFENVSLCVRRLRHLPCIYQMTLSLHCLN